MAKRKKYRWEELSGADWCDQMNAISLQGWEVKSFERHSSAQVWVLFEMEIEVEDRHEKGKRNG